MVSNLNSTEIDLTKVVFNENLERQVLENGESDHKFLMLGIDNCIFSILKFTEINPDFLNNIFTILPKGLKIVGILYVYNENLYEDFEEIFKSDVEVLKENSKDLNFLQSKIYYFLTKEVLCQNKLELESYNLYDLKKCELSDVSYNVSPLSEILKTEFAFCYTNICTTKDKIKELYGNKEGIDSSKLVFNLGTDIVIDLNEYNSQKDKSLIDEIVYKAIISDSENSSSSYFTANSKILNLPQVKDNKDLQSSISVFQSECKIEVFYKGENDSVKVLNYNANSENVYASECFIWRIKNKEAFHSAFELSINSLIKKLENISAEKTGIFFNEVFYTLPLIVSEKQLDFIQKSFIKFKLETYYPNDNNLLLSTSKLLNVHSKLKRTFNMCSKVSYVKGLYEFHHYLQDNFNDDGWGCAYRSLQCLYSWFIINNILNSKNKSLNISIPDIQKTLVKMGDKQESFIGSKTWIGAFEVNLILNELLGVESKIIHLSSGNDIKTKARELAHHFETIGSPIMIGGGVYAYTILGIYYNFITGECEYLILDPHYKEKDDINVVIAKGGISWKTNKLFDKNSFYNLCLPQINLA